MDAVFFFRTGRGAGPPLLPARPGEVIELQENQEYFLQFRERPSAADLARLHDLGFEWLTETQGLLTFANYVGELRIGQVAVRVRSTKLGEGGLEALLTETAVLAAELIYGWKSRTSFEAGRAGLRRRRIAYHDLLLVRSCVLSAPSGERLSDWVATIAAAPVRRFEQQYVQTPISSVQDVDITTLGELARHPEHLVRLPSGHSLAGHPLAERLGACAPSGGRFFPVSVRQPQQGLSFDTLENRLVRTVLDACAEVVVHFVGRRDIGRRLQHDCQVMAEELRVLSRVPFLQRVPPLAAPPMPSQVLLKQAGYREVFGLYRRLSEAVSLPTDAVEMQRFLDGKDVATLYEYWAFLVMVKVVAQLTGAAALQPHLAAVGDLGVLLPRGTHVDLSSGARISYNRSYPHHATEGSYSTTFRPDISVRWAGREHVFDAKYKLQTVHGWDEEGEEEVSQTFKKTDLYKMHSYRDALAQVDSAWVLYPGGEFRFFAVDGTKHVHPEGLTGGGGVGAVPLRPGTGQEALHRMLARLLQVA
ncbi:MAG TPA: DUF2357 domain-containing protein [Myxococcaceae bacterium]|jgi:hypothetical protein